VVAWATWQWESARVGPSQRGYLQRKDRVRLNPFYMLRPYPLGNILSPAFPHSRSFKSPIRSAMHSFTPTLLRGFVLSGIVGAHQTPFNSSCSSLASKTENQRHMSMDLQALDELVSRDEPWQASISSSKVARTRSCVSVLTCHSALSTPELNIQKSSVSL
jgi:hypothetical protein